MVLIEKATTVPNTVEDETPNEKGILLLRRALAPNLFIFISASDPRRCP